MRADLEQKLYDKYPELFADRTLPASKSLMCFGLDVDDGWYTIIDTLCWVLVAELRYLEGTDLPLHERMVEVTDRSTWTTHMHAAYTPENVERLRARLVEMKADVPRFTQVKEKFGGLRIYHRGGSPEQKTAISMAMALSYKTCETCGASGPDAGVRRWPFSWIRTQCRGCAVAKNGEEAVQAVEQGKPAEED